MKTLNVLFVSSGGGLAGAERCLLEAATVLAKRGVRPIVAVPDKGPLANELAARGLDARVMELGVLRNRGELSSPVLVLRLLQQATAAVRLAHLIRRENIDLVHSNTTAVCAGPLAALLARRPHVWHTREMLPAGPLPSLLRRLIPRLSRRVICISTAVRTQFDACSPGQRRKLRLIPDGIDVDRFAATAQSVGEQPDGALRVGMNSRLNPWKGHLTFVAAAALVRRSFPDTRFYVVGGCLPVYEPLRSEIVATIGRLGLGGALTLTGYLPYDDVARMLSTYDVFVLPSSSPEPLGIVLLEAMACGKPIVATNHGGPLDVVEDGVTGLLVPPDDPATMASAIQRLLASPKTRAEMGRAGAARVRALYTLDHHVAQLLELYAEATGWPA